MKLFGNVFSKVRHIVVSEDRIIETLRILNASKIYNVTIGDCGWEGMNVWFVNFDCREKRWEQIRNELKVIRVWSNNDIPKTCGNAVYSTD